MSLVIAPSILSADSTRLGDVCKHILEGGANWLHVDIMDGHFVPNLSFGPQIVKSLRKEFPNVFIDCHLMVSTPEKWIDTFANAGASSITFHYESIVDHEKITFLIKKIKEHKLKVGMAFKPSTPLNDAHINEIDMLLIMTVEPGFGGQELVPSCIEKVKQAHIKWPHLSIQVDGGLTLQNMGELVRSGANVFVAGTMLIQNDNPELVIEQMKRIYNDNIKNKIAH